MGKRAYARAQDEIQKRARRPFFPRSQVAGKLTQGRSVVSAPSDALAPSSRSNAAGLVPTTRTLAGEGRTMPRTTPFTIEQRLGK